MKITMALATVILIAALLLSGCTTSGPTTPTGTTPAISMTSSTTISTSPAMETTTPITGTTSTGTTTTEPVQNIQTGTLQMWVTDAPRSDNITEIWVTVSEVKIHKGTVEQTSNYEGDGGSEGEIDDGTETGEWIPVDITGPERFDLLTLRGENGGIQQFMATTDLEPGRYTQIRMTVKKVEVMINGELKDATMPSGKLKFVRAFDIEADGVTKLLFDFDADKFINVTGSPKNPKIIAKPVVKMTVSRPQSQGNAVQITTPLLPNGEVGVSYNATVEATGGLLPYTWSIATGNLTPGLTLSTEGTISGIPEAKTAGEHTFTVQVSDNATPAKDDTREYTITITEATETTETLTIITSSFADGQVGVSYNVTLEAAGGTLPYSWNITIGMLPDGLELDPDTGIISGIPTTENDYVFTVEVSDNATPSNIDTRELTIKITGT